MPFTQVFELYDAESVKLIASASTVEAFNAALCLLTREGNGRIRPHFICVRIGSEIGRA